MYGLTCIPATLSNPEAYVMLYGPFANERTFELEFEFMRIIETDNVVGQTSRVVQLGFEFERGPFNKLIPKRGWESR